MFLWQHTVDLLCADLELKEDQRLTNVCHLISFITSDCTTNLPHGGDKKL